MDDIVNVKQLMEALQVSRKWVYEKMHHPDPSERLPHVKLGRTLRFRKRDVESWINAHSRNSEVVTHA